MSGDRVDDKRWRVGELAQATGLTVRTLHHFDAIGLLCPVERSAGGHRLYTGDDVRRLYQILALRQLDVPLAEIAAELDSRGADLRTLAARQLERVDQRLWQWQQLRRRLATLIRAAGESREPSIDLIFQAVEATMDASYFTPEQLARAKARHDQPGFADSFARWQRDAAEIVQELSAQLALGADPADPAVQELAGRWQAVMREMVDSDSAGLSQMYAKIEGKGPEQATRGILSKEVWEYLKQIFAVGFDARR